MLASFSAPLDLFIRYIVSLTEYAVRANVTIVEMTQTAKNSHKTLFRISRYEIMDTVDGINKRGIFLSKNPDTGSKFFGLITFETSRKNRIIIARMLPGKGKGKNFAMISENIKSAKRAEIFTNIFKEIHLGIKWYHKLSCL